MNVDAVFTWDPEKADRNLRVHGISFDMAVEAFGDPRQIVQENHFSGDEQRYALIGMTNGLRLVLVVFVDRSIESDSEVIRLISARNADKYETNAYNDQFA